MATIKHAAILAAAASIGPGTHAAAQTIQGGYEFRVSNVVSPSQPTATVEVWAWFDNVPGVSEVFGGGNFDLVASDGEWSWNFVFPLIRPDPGPIVSGSSIIGVGTGQLHIPQVGFFGDPSNPIWIFADEWSTTDFTPRSVSLNTTNTNSFFVAAWKTGATFEIWPEGFIPGNGAISVVPAPGSLVVLSGALVIARSRRLHRRPTGAAKLRS